MYMELPAQRQCKLTIYSKVREVIKKIFAIGIPTVEGEKKKVSRHIFSEAFFVKGLS